VRSGRLFNYCFEVFRIVSLKLLTLEFEELTLDHKKVCREVLIIITINTNNTRSNDIFEGAETYTYVTRKYTSIALLPELSKIGPVQMKVFCLN